MSSKKWWYLHLHSCSSLQKIYIFWNLHRCIAMPVNHCFLQLKKQIAKKDKQLYSPLTGAQAAGEGKSSQSLLIRYGQSDPYRLRFPPTNRLPMRHKRRHQRQVARAFEQDSAGPGSPVAPTCKHLAGPSPPVQSTGQERHCCKSMQRLLFHIEQ